MGNPAHVISVKKLVPTSGEYLAALLLHLRQSGQDVQTKTHRDTPHIVTYLLGDEKLGEVVSSLYPGPDYGTFHYVADRLTHLEFQVPVMREMTKTECHFFNASLRRSSVDSGVPPWLTDQCRAAIAAGLRSVGPSHCQVHAKNKFVRHPGGFSGASITTGMSDDGPSV